MLSTRRQSRPTRAEIDPAALDLIARYGSQILATARRYSLNADDAEDAYQRGLEILLTKAPTTREQELVPWLKTVVKHEAFAIRRQRERATPVDDTGLFDREAHEHDTGVQAERYERLRLGAEALKRLKPQEVRCLLLRAEGYSYKQICEITGWTYTKVNRCLTEGRAAFLARVEGIQSGAECERLAPLLSALADGEATAADMAALRPHLRGCLACRARLREYRAAPARVAALVPPAAFVGGTGGGGAGDAGGWLDSLLGWLGERGTAIGVKAQSAASGAFDVASAQKVAAVAASTAVLAGGGVATVQHLDAPSRAERPAPAAEAPPVRPASAIAPAAAPAASAAPSPDRVLAASRDRAGTERSPAGAERSAEPDAAAGEFELTGNPPAPAPSPPPTRRPAPLPPAAAADRGGGSAPQPSPAEAEFGF